MIISKTPYRISFFGGGTDYPQWYLKNNGQVVSTSINKYIYITCRYLPKFFDHKYRIIWSRIELVNSLNDINHPSIREVLKFLKIKDGLEIHYDGDLPSRSGIGSSSSFTVGLLNALYALKKKKISKKMIALKSIHVEQNILKEVVGSQDQIASSYGGLNHIKFYNNGSFKVHKLNISEMRKKKLEKNLLLFFTGIKRTAEKVASTYVFNMKNLSHEMSMTNFFVDEFLKILKNGSIDDVGYLLDESWNIKRKFSSVVSNKNIDKYIEIAKSNGALGCKILGAGSGGFLLVYAKNKFHKSIIKSLNNLIEVPFHFENQGTTIIFKENNI